MQKHYGLTIVWLALVIMLLLLLYSYVLSNQTLFIEDVNARQQAAAMIEDTSEDTIVDTSDNTIQGMVVSAGEPRYQMSRKIIERELEALEQGQLLQQNAPEEIHDGGRQFITAENVLDTPVLFAPEVSEELFVKVLPEEQASANYDQVVDELTENDVRPEQQIQDVAVDTSELKSTSEVVVDSSLVLAELRSMPYTDIKFLFNEMTISVQGLVAIEESAVLLKQFPHIHAKILNYTDSYGDNNYNLELSQKRAQTVYEAYLAEGVNRKQLSYSGLGESNPIAGNETLEGRRKNRRTEIQFVEADKL
ncbi:MAG: OmpA family protein [Arenicella sp.]